MATAAIIPAETVILIAEALSDAARELAWFCQTFPDFAGLSGIALTKVRAAKVALQMITDGQ